MAQLYADDGKINEAVDTYEKALELHPTPEQRIQMRLILGLLLQKQGFNGAARLDYQRLLAESPDYPGRANIDDKIDSLAAADLKTKK
jgi:tetratricopeptide (TPR) repeat protein